MEELDEVDDFGAVQHSWKSWRAMAGYIYLAICLFDFVIMPSVVHANRIDPTELVSAVETPDDKQFVLSIVDKMNTKRWEPITTAGGGLFHVSFGFILTGVAISGRKAIVNM